MDENKLNINDEVNYVFRHEYGKLVAILTKRFGTHNLELAEDVVQESLLEAVKQWEYKGVPDNPAGWVYRVANFKALNIIKKEKYKFEKINEIEQVLYNESNDFSDLIFTKEEIADDQLRMMFTCCHPSISQDSQIALILKTLCGFSIPEISQAFLTSQESINKRLTRARKTIRDAKISFEVPLGKELDARFLTVLESIYLLFNEGYNSSSGDKNIRQDLCDEAIRLAEIMVLSPILNKQSSLYALLALMTLNTSRFDARVDKDNLLIDLEHQDRSLWDTKMIQKGLLYLQYSAQQKTVSVYHVLATISANHCAATTFNSTDWKAILSLYNNLLQLDTTPIIRLNRAIVLVQLNLIEEALIDLEEVNNSEELRNYLPFYTTYAKILELSGQVEKAIIQLEMALQLPIKESDKNLIQRVKSDIEKNS